MFSGKTAVAVALAHIFGFGHTESDDVQGKKPPPVFIKNVTKLLEKKDMVITDKFVSFLFPLYHRIVGLKTYLLLDRINHLKQHRQQLCDAVRDLCAECVNLLEVLPQGSFSIFRGSCYDIP